MAETDEEKESECSQTAFTVSATILTGQKVHAVAVTAFDLYAFFGNKWEMNR